MSDQPFPPADAAAFLGLCAGVWMSLRSSFELSSGGDDDWHSSERGELVVRSGESADASVGELVVTAPGGRPPPCGFNRVVSWQLMAHRLGSGASGRTAAWS